MIKEIEYNWHQNGDADGYGEDFHFAEVGSLHLTLKKVVKSITKVENKFIYDIEFVDGSSLLVFNPNLVYVE